MPPVDILPAERPFAAAILLHPHPAMGGDRFNHIIDALYRGLPSAGISAVRFDFRSADPDLAAEEARSVLDQTATRPVVLIGYSFGADVATKVADERLAGWFLVAPPLSLVAPGQPVAAVDPRPKALAVAEYDQYSPPEAVRQATLGWENTTVAMVPGADHFLAGHTGEVVRLALDWLRSPAVMGNDRPRPPFDDQESAG